MQAEVTSQKETRAKVVGKSFEEVLDSEKCFRWARAAAAFQLSPRETSTLPDRWSM